LRPRRAPTAAWWSCSPCSTIRVDSTTVTIPDTAQEERRTPRSCRDVSTTSFYDLDGEELDLLHRACSAHSDGLTDADVTVQVCWDADRLDLGRVGIEPSPARLCTQAARDPKMIAWAYRRSVDG
jgi:hypothetical protein